MESYRFYVGMAYRYIGLANISAIFHISDSGIGWNSTDINIGYRQMIKYRMTHRGKYPTIWVGISVKYRISVVI